MSCLFNKPMMIAFVTCMSCFHLVAQRTLHFRLPDTGQTGNYSSRPGEDSDYILNPPSFSNNGDGTITDNNTGLMWEKTDGGEMTFEDAVAYCGNLTLAGYSDWRLPIGIELFSINNYNHVNPALNTDFFTLTQAEYWWTSETRADDTTKIWVVNAGGGIGAHPKTETVSAGGTKFFHVRAVRNAVSAETPADRYSDNGNGTITDNYTGLIWQKIQPPDSMTWEEALSYSLNFSLAGKADWRLPNVKELQSLNDVKLFKPSFDRGYSRIFFKAITGLPPLYCNRP